MYNPSRHNQSKGLLRLPDVLKLYPVSPAHWWRGVKSGAHPPAIKLSPRITAWRVEDIEKLIREAGEK